MLYFIQLTEQQGVEKDRRSAVFFYFKNFCTLQNLHDTIFKLERNEAEL